MTTPLAALHDRLLPHFKPAFIQRDYTCFQFRFEAGEPFYLTVTPTAFTFSAGEKTHPTLTLFLDTHETAEGLLDGSINSMDAFMEGRYRADGNIVLSQLLLYLFRIDDPTIAYRVQD